MSADGEARSHWFDDEAGPVVRPYAMTRGRTSHAAQHRLDLIAVVVTEPHVDDAETDNALSPEHVDIVELCRRTPQSVAELAAELDLPIGWCACSSVTSWTRSTCTSTARCHRRNCRTRASCAT